MFKSLIIYQFNSQECPLDGLASMLERATFQPCGATQAISRGFVPPRGIAHGPLAENFTGQVLLSVMTESKKVPSDAVKRLAEEKAQALEQSTGRKPGKKMMKEIKEEALLELLPKALPTRSRNWVWIDKKAGRLMIEAGSQRTADDIITMLVKLVDGLAVSLVHTEMSPATAMSHWLATGESPQGFTVDRECELKASDATKAVVRYARHTLDIDEVRQHIQHGKIPTRLSLTWKDRVSLTLTAAFTIKQIALLDLVFADKGASAVDEFDASVVIATEELSQMLSDLIDGLGGICQQAPAADSTTAHGGDKPTTDPSEEAAWDATEKQTDSAGDA